MTPSSSKLSGSSPAPSNASSDDDVMSPDQFMASLSQASSDRDPAMQRALAASYAEQTLREQEDELLGDSEDRKDIDRDEEEVTAGTVLPTEAEDWGSPPNLPPDIKPDITVPLPSSSLKRSLDSSVGPRPKRVRHTGSPSSTPLPSSSLRQRDSNAAASQSSSETRTEPEPMQKSTKFWAMDGSVIVQVENIGFRVHRSILVQHSKFFEKLFDKPADRRVNDIPLHVVHGSPKDFEAILDVLNNPLQLIEDDPKLPVLAPILRAACIWDFTKYQTFAEKRICKLFTDSIDEIPLETSTYATTAVLLAYERFGNNSQRRPHIESIIRPAMYDLVRQDDFGMHASLNGHAGEANPIGPLTPLIVRRLIEARVMLSTVWRTACAPPDIFRSAERPTDCTCAEDFGDGVEDENASKRRTPDQKLVVWVRTINGPPNASKPKKGKGKGKGKARAPPNADTLEDPTISDIGVYDPLYGLQLLINEPFRDLECETCLKSRKKNWKGTRVSVWRNLQDVFGVSVVKSTHRQAEPIDIDSDED